MTRTAGAGVATIKIFVLFERGTGVEVRSGKLQKCSLAAHFFHVVLHGMHTFMHTGNRHGQHNHEQKLRNEFRRKYFFHNYIVQQ